MVERKFKEGYSAPELKELEKELDKKAEEWYSLDEVTVIMQPSLSAGRIKR